VHVAVFLANTGGEYVQYTLKRPSLWSITGLTSPEIIDTLWTLSSRIAQGAYRCFFSLYRQPVRHLWIFATNRHAEVPWSKAKHYWRTVDAHFQNGAGCVPLSLLLVNAAYTSFITVRIQWPLRLPKMPDHKSLTHHWLLFSGWGREGVSLVFLYKSR